MGYVPASADPVANGIALQTAIDAASPGDTITLDPFGLAGRWYQANLILPKKATGLTIRSTALASLPAGVRPNDPREDASQLGFFARLTNHFSASPLVHIDSAILFAIGAHHYTLQGLDITTAPGSMLAGWTVGVLVSCLDWSGTNDPQHDIVYDRLLIHPSETGLTDYFRSAGRGLGANGIDITVKHSCIYGFGAYGSPPVAAPYNAWTVSAATAANPCVVTLSGSGNTIDYLPGSPLTDPFDGTETPLAAPWTNAAGAAWQKSGGNAATANAGVNCFAGYTEPPGPSATRMLNHASQMVRSSGGAASLTGALTGPCVRLNSFEGTTSVSGYVLYANGTTNYLLGRITNGVITTLATYAVAPALGDTIRLEARGTQLRALRNGTVLGADVNDNTYLDGYPGIFGNASTTNPLMASWTVEAIVLRPIAFRGATGANWSQLNGTFIATNIDATHASLETFDPVTFERTNFDTTGFGALTGAPLRLSLVANDSAAIHVGGPCPLTLLDNYLEAFVYVIFSGGNSQTGGPSQNTTTVESVASIGEVTLAAPNGTGDLAVDDLIAFQLAQPAPITSVSATNPAVLTVPAGSHRFPVGAMIGRAHPGLRISGAAGDWTDLNSHLSGYGYQQASWFGLVLSATQIQVTGLNALGRNPATLGSSATWVPASPADGIYADQDWQVGKVTSVNPTTRVVQYDYYGHPIAISAGNGAGVPIAVGSIAQHNGYSNGPIAATRCTLACPRQWLWLLRDLGKTGRDTGAIPKGILEFKTGHDVTFDGCTFEIAGGNAFPMYPQGMIGNNQVNQIGSTPWINLNNWAIRNCLIENMTGVKTGHVDEWYSSTHSSGFLLDNCLFTYPGPQSDFLIPAGIQNMTITHCTVRNGGTPLLAIFTIFGMLLRDNILNLGTYGYSGVDGAVILPEHFDNNLIVDNRSRGAFNWSGPEYANDTLVASEAAVGFVDLTGADAGGNYHGYQLAIGSPYKGTATEGGGKDPGVDFALLDAALAGEPPPQTKPAAGSTINMAHALAPSFVALMLEGAGSTTEVFRNGVSGSVPLGASVGWMTDADGHLLTFVDAAAYLDLGVGGFTNTSGNFSVFFRGVAKVNGEYHMAGATAGAGQDDYAWGVTSTNTWGLHTGTSIAAPTSLPTDGVQYDVGIVYQRGVQVTFSIYAAGVGGALIARETVAYTTLPAVTGQTAKIGNFSTSGASWRNPMSFQYAWNGRLLTNAEVDSLHADPYQFVVAPTSPTVDGSLVRTLGNVTLVAVGNTGAVTAVGGYRSLFGFWFGLGGVTAAPPCVSSTFTGDEPVLSEGAVWTSWDGGIKKVGGFATAVTINTNHGFAAYTGRTWANDQSSKVVRGNAGSYTDVAVGVRMHDAPNAKGYVFYAQEGVQFNLIKLTNNYSDSPPVLATYPVIPGPTDVIELKIEGNTLTPVVNGVPFTPVVDPTPYTSGAPGFTVFTSVADATAIDFWEGCDLGVAPADVTGTLAATLGPVTLFATGTTGSPAAPPIFPLWLIDARATWRNERRVRFFMGDVVPIAPSGGPPIGVLSQVLDPVTLVAAGTTLITGSSAIVLGPVTMVGVGNTGLVGALAQVLDPVTLVAVGITGAPPAGAVIGIDMSGGLTAGMQRGLY
jgi:hypothetical protein